MTARIASGRAIAPRLVRMVNDKELPEVEAPPLDIPPDLLAAVRGGMNAVVNGDHGTGKSSRVVDPAMTFAGKSGTSQVRNISKAERDSGVVSNDDLPWNRRDHALFVGFFGSVLVAMVTRVTQGHSGQALTMPKAAWWAFAMLQVVAVARIVAELADDPMGWMAFAAIGWLLAFAPWVLRIGRIYLSPRADGKPG